MKFNEQLARNALKAIERNPQEWSQEVWRCQTGMCFAGFVAFEAGARWLVPTVNDKFDPDEDTVITPDGRTMHAADYAAEQLGVDEEHEMDFFSPANGIDDLKYVVDVHSGKA